MIHQILIYPDKRLRKKSAPVTKFDATLATLLDDMHDTMVSYRGVGLAAIQIGVAQQIIVINIPTDEGVQPIENRFELINSRIVSSEGGVLYSEGCLSIPEYNEEIMRFEQVSIEYCDRHGNQKELNAKGLLAIAIQHETDHIEGRLFVERLPLLKRKKFEKEWKKSLKNG
ncbi:peptide deformylase [Campylobacterota bacterium]|nr:peptide deformylase [Campylobacterota bacterium]